MTRGARIFGEGRIGFRRAGTKKEGPRSDWILRECRQVAQRPTGAGRDSVGGRMGSAYVKDSRA